jgi:hypothetical protein
MWYESDDVVREKTPCRDAVQVQERGAWAASASGRVDFILRAMAGSKGNCARKQNSENDFIFWVVDKD